MKATFIVIQNEAHHADAHAVASYGAIIPVLLAYLMDQHHLTRADLVPLLGTTSRVSEVLTGKSL